MEEFTPLDKFTIKDLETLKVIADPLRMQLLEALSLEPLTVKELAERLGLAASKLYYHMKLLEDHQFIQVVATRIVSGIIEKQYRATADKLDIDKDLFTFRTNSGKENLTSMVAVTIDATRNDILRSLEARHFELEQGNQEQPRRLTLIRDLSRISDARADEFHARLHDLMQEFTSADEPAPANPTKPPHMYAMLLSLYPTFYFHEEGNLGQVDSKQ